MFGVMTYTPIFAALVAFLFLALSARVILYRRANRIGLGDAGDTALLRRIRAQSNCAEYAPLGLLLLLVLELQGWSGPVLILTGLLLLAGRAAHAYGFSSQPEKMNLRVAGMGLTLTMIGLAAALALIGALV